MKPAEMLALFDIPGRTRGVGRIECVRGPEKVMLPLAGVTMKARVAERVARVTVTQTFRNPFPDALEAVYIFPLAGGCAVSDFEMRVGKRVIKGTVKERQEARATYEKAMAEGKRAALMEQERDDVFTVSVGNIPPGEDVTVVIETAERLPYFDDGMTELRLPVVVAPRYIAGTPVDGQPTGDGVESDTDAVPDASRITPPRLAEGFDPKVSLGIEVELLTSGEELRDVACSQHAVRTSLRTDAVGISLSSEQEPLDRDFVLRWRVAAAAVRTSCVAWRDDKGRRFAMLSVVPPRRDGFLGLARDVVFVLDHSGSMEGIKMASAARSCSMLLQTLGPRDRFAIVAFDNSTSWMVSGGVDRQFIPADDAGIARGVAFLRTISADGGTELAPALDESLSAIGARRERSGRSPIVVILTDGEVGDESGILKILQKNLGDARTFTVGIDTAVNSGFLKRLASLGGGTASFVTPGSDLEEALRAVGREIGQPLVTDLALDKKGVEAESLSPARIPDLFAGRAASAYFLVKSATTVRVRGRFANGAAFDETVPVRDIDQPAIAHLWARTRVSELEDQFRLHPEAQADLKSQIVRLACEHTLLTRFTAFVAVDHSEIVNRSGEARKVVQPVEMPAKWEMDKNVLPAPLSVAPECCSAAGSTSEEICKDEGECSPSKTPMEFAKVPPPPPKAKRLSAVGGALPGSCPPAPKPAPMQAIVSSRSRRADDGGSGDAGISDKDRESFTKALELFTKAFATALAEIRSGRVPEPESLEEARVALVKTLAGSPMGSEVPMLQKFLRMAAVELVAACGAEGSTAAGLREMFEGHAKSFESAMKEADSALASRSGKRWWAFWEKSI
ncbi:MAG: VIT and VWA domain-containing protein [Planctomycetes bacterium]|nr:VIT and VWA domain-containing protein [Planctomycetota bacterium]